MFAYYAGWQISKFLEKADYIIKVGKAAPGKAEDASKRASSRCWKRLDLCDQNKGSNDEDDALDNVEV